MMSKQTLPLTGGCLCGSVRYAATELPSDVNYCHCRMCQKWSGSAMVVAAEFPHHAVTFSKKQPEIYKSSDIGERGFCADCGSPLFFRYLEKKTIYMAVGTLDHPENAPPRIHTCVDTQVPWLSIDDDLPRESSEDDAGAKAIQALADKTVAD